MNIEFSLNFGQSIDDQNPSEGGIEVQEEVENRDLLSPSSSSLVIWPVSEGVVAPGDVTSGSASLNQHVEDLVENFQGFYSKWINDNVKEVRFYFPSDNL